MSICSHLLFCWFKAKLAQVLVLSFLQKWTQSNTHVYSEQFISSSIVFKWIRSLKVILKQFCFRLLTFDILPLPYL